MSVFTETKTLKSLKLVPALDIIITEHITATLKDGVVIAEKSAERSYSNNQIETFNMEVAPAGASIAAIVTSFNAAAIEERDSAVAAKDAAVAALATAQAKVDALQAQIDAYTPPVAPVVPAIATMRQAREALIRRGFFATVDGYIAAMPGIEGDIARNEWEMSQTVERNRPLTLAMAALLGMDQAAMDEFYAFALTL